MRRYSLLLGLLAFGPFVGLQAVPSFEEVRSSYKSSEAVYLDRRGRILQSIRLDESGRRLAWTSLDRISPALLNAVVRSEDKRFYSHSGADYLAILKAALGRIAKDTRRGASTITMQLASRLDDSLAPSSRGRTYEQKWRQIQAAREIEKTWSKSQILEAYLNLVPFRGELEGVSAASFGLFGKDPHALGDTESVILAALIRGPQASAEDVMRRSCMLAYSMKLPYDCSQIKPDVARAFEGSHAIRPTASYAPHLSALIKSGESEIRTTLDLDIQLAVREILHRHILSVRNRNVRDGAVLVLDNRTGEVIAYVGSTGDLSLAPLVDSIRSRRQAGSALKPFVYAVGIDKRLITASTLLDDTPLNMPVFSGVYHPENYDRDYFGPVPARIALASSRNIPAVRLVSLLGVDSVLDVFRKMEFKNLEEADFYGPSIALGSLDVTLWQLTSAYRMFASGGEWSSPFVERTSAVPAKRRIVSEAAAFIIGDILSDRESRSLTFGLENVLSTPFWTAVKTGTSKDMRDNWCVGYSDRYTVGVWVGNASGEPMWNVLGVTGAAPVWQEVMRVLHADSPSRAPGLPDSVAIQATEYGKEYYIKGTEPAHFHEIEPRDPRILYPESGTIFALDPEIPPERQRIFFRAASVQSRLQWKLDGKVIGEHNPAVWKPARGSHKLTLLLCDHACAETQSVEFSVR